ncbi:hypothetical protein NN6n1_13000 [Shinella zoogloeoides]
MNATVAARQIIREAWPLSRHGKVANIIHHVVRFVGPRVAKPFTSRRALAIWHGEARRIDSEEMDALRQALIEEQKREQRELRARLAELDKALAASDPAFFGASVAQEVSEAR